MHECMCVGLIDFSHPAAVPCHSCKGAVRQPHDGANLCASVQALGVLHRNAADLVLQQAIYDFAKQHGPAACAMLVSGDTGFADILEYCKACGCMTVVIGRWASSLETFDTTAWRCCASRYLNKIRKHLWWRAPHMPLMFIACAWVLVCVHCLDVPPYAVCENFVQASEACCREPCRKLPA